MMLLDYFYWHYSVAPSGIWGVFRNYLIGTWHKFLIATHLKTLVAPWHRAKPSELGTTKTFGDKILNAIVNFYIRIIAAFVRLIIILIGLVAELIVAVAFITLLIVWFLWPAVFILWVGKGLGLVF